MSDWDARRYHVVSQPHADWGDAVLDRLALQGGETVLDAGCGSGRVTAALLERLPRGRVIAADRSRAMLDQARHALAPFLDRVTLVEVDLVQLDTVLADPVDAVFSTATFHWIAGEQHPRLFEAIYRVLRPGGRLAAQCGGGKNLARLERAADRVAQREPYAEYLGSDRLWRYMADVPETEARLRAAGFNPARAWLEPSPQTFADRAAFCDFTRAVNLKEHLARLPAELADAFVESVAESVRADLGSYTLDYERLNLDAQRPV